MSVKIRLQRRGRRKKPFYHIVVADARAPRDGRFIEKLGTYNPMTSPATIDLDRDRTFDWLMKGAQPTDTARAILKFQGVMFRKHLQRGVIKGALSQEQADEQYRAWVADKDSKTRARQAATAEEKAEWHKKLSGTAKPIVVKVEETPEEVAEESAVEASEEAPAAESADETPADATSEETPAAEEETPVAEATEEEVTESEDSAEASTETAEEPSDEPTESTTEEAAEEETPAAEAEANDEAPEEAPTEEESAVEEAVAKSEEATSEEKTEEETTEEDTTEEDTTEEKG